MNVVENINNTLVYDFGSATSKFGFSGDVSPIIVVPSTSAQKYDDEGGLENRFGEMWLNNRYNGLETTKMIDDDGTFKNKDLIDSFIDYTLDISKIEEASGYSILLNQPSCTKALTGSGDHYYIWRKTLAEKFFDFLDSKSICFQHDSVLSCYAFGVHTGLSVDFGWSCIRNVPVYEGHPLLNAVTIHRLGGYGLVRYLDGLLKQNRKEVLTLVHPKRFDFLPELEVTDTFRPTESHAHYCTFAVMSDMIKSHIKYTDEIPKSDHSDILDYVYHMPGHYPLDIKDEIVSMTPLLWNVNDSFGESLTNLINHSVNVLTPPSFRKPIWSNIVACGGFSKIKGFRDKLQRTLVLYEKTAKVLPPRDKSVTGEFSVWTGGSIFSSFPGFSDLCITKEEWKEVGDNILRLKCL